MTKRRKQAIILLALSGPMMWFGLTNFMADKTFSIALSIGIAIACTLGLAFAISGLVMMVTKNSLGILNPDDKGRGEILASQTSKDSPISLPPDFDPDEAKGQNQKAIDDLVLETTDHAIKSLGGFIAGGKPMVKKSLTKGEKPMPKKQTTIAEKVKRFRKLGQVKKDANSERADIKAELKSENMLIDEDGKIEIEE